MVEKDEFPDFEKLSQGKSEKKAKPAPAVSRNLDSPLDLPVFGGAKKSAPESKPPAPPKPIPPVPKPKKVKVKKEKPKKKVKKVHKVKIKKAKVKKPKAKKVKKEHKKAQVKKEIPKPASPQIQAPSFPEEAQQEVQKATPKIEDNKVKISQVPKPVAPILPVEFGAIKKSVQKIKQVPSKYPSLKLVDEREIAMDFAAKVYERYDKLIKSVVLFGSQNKDTATTTSDIDIIIIVDDASIKWDDELVAWYREELGKIIQTNPYRKSLHINSVRLTTWWQDMIMGDPIVINVLRYGESLIDFGGFFNPLKVLLQSGRIKSTPEAIYSALQRAPLHLSRSRVSKLSSIEGIYWAMVDSAHALLMAAKQVPPSPEHVPIMLKEIFVDTKQLKIKYVVWYRDIYLLHRKIVHGILTEIKGEEIDEWQAKADEFMRVMTALVKRLVE
ncbi:MAG: nucleotidyltransferase domain-containing protein [archaeon]